MSSLGPVWMYWKCNGSPSHQLFNQIRIENDLGPQWQREHSWEIIFNIGIKKKKNSFPPQCTTLILSKPLILTSHFFLACASSVTFIMSVDPKGHFNFKAKFRTVVQAFVLIFLAPNATIIAPLSKVTPTRVSFVFVFFDKARSYHSNLFPGPGIFYLWCTIIAILSQCFQLYPSPLIFQFLFSCLLSLKFSVYFSSSVKYRQEVTIQGKNVFFTRIWTKNVPIVWCLSISPNFLLPWWLGWVHNKNLLCLS